MIPLRSRLPVRWKVFSVAVCGLLAITLWLRATATPPAPPPPAPPPHSIAVVPFRNAVPDSSLDYLGPGVAGEIAGALRRVDGLRVAASGPGETVEAEDPLTVGTRLGVGSVLIGAVRQAGDRLRLTVHLMSVEGGFDIWSETYERSASDLLAVEDEIVAAIVAALRLRGPAGEPVPSASVAKTSPEAHAAFLRGRFDLERASAAASAGAAREFADAVRLDSLYAPAWAGLAEAHLVRLITEAAPPKEAAALARAAVDRALALDSTSAEAWVSRAVLALLYDRDYPATAAMLRRADEIAPGLAAAYHWQSHRLLVLGEVDSSLAASRRAIESSPLDAGLLAHLGWHYLLARQDSLAEAAFSRALAMDSRRVLADEHLRWKAMPPGDSGITYDSLQVASKSRYVSPYAVAVAAAAAGKTGQALDALSLAISERSPSVVYARLDPRLDPIRGNRRFQTLLRRLAAR